MCFSVFCNDDGVFDCLQTDESKLEMTAEEEEFFMKMATVILKAQAMNGLALATDDSSLEKRYPTGTGQCSVSGNAANCCGNFGFNIKLGFINQRVDLDGCVTGEFLPDKYGIHVTATFNGYKIIDEEISGTNPPAICAGIPKVKFVSVCVKVSNIDFSNVGACFAVKANVFGKTLADIDLGCITTI